MPNNAEITNDDFIKLLEEYSKIMNYSFKNLAEKMQTPCNQLIIIDPYTDKYTLDQVFQMLNHIKNIDNELYNDRIEENDNESDISYRENEQM